MSDSRPRCAVPNNIFTRNSRPRRTAELMFIQICPALMDWIVFLVLFAVLYGAGERGFSALECAWITGIGQLTYMAASLLAGLVLTRRNAGGFLLASTVMGAVRLLVTTVAPQMACQALLFVCLAFFFNSFQTFMRGEMAPSGLARTLGRYTLAWSAGSAGSAGGFFSSGSLYQLGDFALCGMTLLVGAVVLATLLRHSACPHALASADEHVEEACGRQAVNPRYPCDRNAFRAVSLGPVPDAGDGPAERSRLRQSHVCHHVAQHARGGVSCREWTLLQRLKHAVVADPAIVTAAGLVYVVEERELGVPAVHHVATLRLQLRA